MSSVTVLTPHGRRQVVKVDPNKTILWILEQVCQKYTEFKAENYDLKHHNKIIDLNQFFRFSGLPNNCTLEMSETDKKRVEQDVVICLQLEDNTRLNGSFQPSKTLYEIINQMVPEKSSGDQSPVVVYMRNEIYGEKLNTTTLKSLGLGSGGRALLRLINSDPESLKVQANVSAPLPQKPKKEEPEKPRPKAVTADSPSFQFQSLQQLKASENIQTIDEKKLEEKMEIEEETPKPILEDVKENVEEMIQETQTKDEKKIEEIAEPIVNILDDRGTIIFTLDSMNVSSFEVPDNFFELNESDIRLLYKDLRKQVEEYENAPLMTAELRKLEENKKILNQLSTYKSCALRIQFPDRHVIQTKFSTVDTIESVMNFVRQFLIDSEMEFHLYVTPPKTILNEKLTLIESRCVPSALLHFGCDENIKEFLKSEYYGKLSSGFGAAKILLNTNENESKSMIDEVKESAPSTSTSVQASIPKNFMDSKVSSKPSGAVPKWFKSGK